MSHSDQPTPTGPLTPQRGDGMRMLKPGHGKRSTQSLFSTILGVIMLCGGLSALTVGVVGVVAYLTADRHEQQFSNSITVTLQAGDARTVWIYGPRGKSGESIPRPSSDACHIVGPDGHPVDVDTSSRSSTRTDQRSASTFGTFRAGAEGGTYTVECEGHDGKLSDPPPVDRLIVNSFGIIGGLLLTIGSVFVLRLGRRR